MARLRPITNQALTDCQYDIKSRDMTIKDGEQYAIAEKMFLEDSKILYFNYWSDKDIAEGCKMMSYSISREDVKWWKENKDIDE